MYAYVVQNPWSAFDPEGLKTKKEYEKERDKRQAELDEYQAALDKKVEAGG
jgi:hypothetical protein